MFGHISGYPSQKGNLQLLKLQHTDAWVLTAVTAVLLLPSSPTLGPDFADHDLTRLEI